ncbi:YslB family protein [Mesobacillus maritimus]|uniref:YslB family protein n=1 Tax=Mesobacillus maritimus TaxID=1643336 RepID=A0ABS7KA31_9BACI|nr:YslB family protein [Mesobacillus maritimus]MBY0099070.1 YslB family protein [Mesobacillus maritimus]
MSELPVSEKYSPNERPSVSLFGYELIRDDLISELLGKDEPEILYWAGKKLARKYPLYSIEEIIAFFQEADWGLLSVKEEKRKELCLSLTGEFVSNRLKKDKNTTFQLEAGFLAQQIEWQKKVVAEAFEHPNKRSNIIQFTIKWDSHDSL